MKKPHIWIASATALIYAQTLFWGFINFDDAPHIPANPIMQLPFFDALKEFWVNPYFNLYLPVTYTVWLVLYKLGIAAAGGAVPALFHGINLALHALNGCLVYRFLGNYTKYALLGALLFVVHPIQAESVAWISSMKELLSFAFGMGALVVSQTKFGFRFKPVGYLLFLLAILTKPTWVILPLAVFLLTREKRVVNVAGKWINVPSFRAPILLGLIAVPVVLMTQFQQPEGLMFMKATLFQKLYLWAYSTGHYIQKIFMPVGLVVDYGKSAMVILSDKNSSNIIVAFAVTVIGVTVALFRKKSAIMSGVVIFMVGWLPVSGFVQFVYQNYSQVADRYMYLPMVGVALALSSGLEELSVFVEKRQAKHIATGVLVVLFAMSTYLQVPIWSDHIRLFNAATSRSTTSYLAHYAIANELKERKQYKEAIGFYTNALRTQPWSLASLAQYTSSLMAIGETKAALPILEEWTENICPNLSNSERFLYGEMLNNRGVAYGKLGRHKEAREKIWLSYKLAPEIGSNLQNLKTLGEVK